MGMTQEEFEALFAEKKAAWEAQKATMYDYIPQSFTDIDTRLDDLESAVSTLQSTVSGLVSDVATLKTMHGL